MRNMNHFHAGRGVYNCGLCHRLTRGAGDASVVELCGECYTLSVLENEYSDTGTLHPESIDHARATLAKLENLVGRPMAGHFNLPF